MIWAGGEHGVLKHRGTEAQRRAGKPERTGRPERAERGAEKIEKCLERRA
jgi:hypothetical protein